MPWPRATTRGACATAAGGPSLAPATRPKDQSYVLHGLRSRDLARVRFPLGRLTKDAVRRLEREAGLPVADKAESQEICFVPSGDYRDLVRERRPDAFAPGEILESSGRVLGTHEGVAGFTVGQRKGLGIAARDPLSVLRLDASARRVVVGPRPGTGLGEASLVDVTWSAIAAPPQPLDADVCLRYQPCTRPQVDSIRGVNSDSIMKSLLSKGLILEAGRTDGPGRPILYSTTPEFLQHFGLSSILELPPLAAPAESDNEHSELLKG